MLRSISCAAAAAFLLLAPHRADAQLRLIPQIGLYAPFTELPSRQQAVDGGKKASTLAYGVAAELGTPDKVSFRVNLLHATDSDVPVPSVGCQDCQRSTVTTASGTLVVRPLPRIILVQPYLLVGGGVKRYDYTRQDFQDEGLNSLFNDQNRLSGHVGVGAEVGLAIVKLNVEISDMMSRFDADQAGTGSNKLQHDAFFTVGLVIGG